MEMTLHKTESQGWSFDLECPHIAQVYNAGKDHDGQSVNGSELIILSNRCSHQDGRATTSHDDQVVQR